MKSVLVTGGSGFLGSYIAGRLMQEGYHAVLMDISPPGPPYDWILNTSGQRYAFEPASVADFSAILHVLKKHKVEAVINAAALTDVDLLKNRPRLAMKINTMGAMNLLEAMRVFEIEKFIQLSSIAVYASKQYEPIDEKHPTHMPDEGPSLYSYSSTKLATEAIGMHYWQEHQINFVALRLSGVYGFGMKYPLYALKSVVEGAVAGEKLEYPAGGAVERDLIHVKDVADLIPEVLARAELSARHRIYNIAHGGKLHSMRDIVDEVKKNYPRAEIRMGEGLTEYEARIQKTRGEISIRAAREAFGYAPRYSLEKGIRDYIHLYTSCRKEDAER